MSTISCLREQACRLPVPGWRRCATLAVWALALPGYPGRRDLSHTIAVQCCRVSCPTTGATVRCRHIPRYDLSA